ncbi:MAG: hypothetical protein M1831_000034 [Alyxoria varia]|nr:MAG: hypothetical protein M1831_000034 [Alyxoria varia]
MAQRAALQRWSARSLSLQQRQSIAAPLAVSRVTALGLAQPNGGIHSNIGAGRIRPTSTITNPKATPAEPSESMQILKNQRLHRPVSPHLTIYQPQITWVLSAMNRVTGLALSGPLYIFGSLYLLSPLLGLKITSVGMAAGFAKWPVIVKFGAKALAAFPFVFHSLNGVRHLVWDMGWALNLQSVWRSGWTVVGLTGVMCLGLAVI